MRGGLDETLARLARREEALRRRAAEQRDPGAVGRGGAEAVGPGGAADAEAVERRGVEDVGQGGPEAVGPGGAADAEVVAAPDGADPGRADGRGGARNAGPGWADARRAGEPRDPVAEVAEAVRRVVAGHPGVAVTVRVEHDGQAYPLRVAWSGTGVTVDAAAPAGPPPEWPVSARTVPAWTPGRDGVSPDPAARLAELIRRDPSVLGDDDPPR
ncbi:hypothetical protein GA0070606_3724 [Micromonospora citrea]|uniref:Uncharacterized protein n=1 Tax=Micromonospora citrea TaxID=47855 RepID=A0A1C6V9I1_9ACTN|nr:hypothetical protein [Micromonospora citrea]SCL63013.1 hypothetical protein GA0070606_3724 [Micromonospora citrea]